MAINEDTRNALPVYIALKAEGCLRLFTKTSGTPPDGDGVKVGAFKDNVDGAGGDAGAQAPHDARKRNRFARVGYQHVL